jgi:O-antigen ligase
LWVIEGLLSRSWQIKGLPLLLPLLALVVLALFQTMTLRGRAPVSADPYETWRFIYKMLALITVGELLSHYTSSRRRLEVLIYVVIGVGIISALFGIVRQVMQHDAAGYGLHYLELGVGFGQFINYNHFAFLMEMTLGLALGLMVAGGVGRERLLLYVAIPLLIGTALVLSNSRGGILSMLSLVLFIGMSSTALRYPRPVTGQTNRTWAWLWHVISSLITRTLLTVFLIVIVAIGSLWIGGDVLRSRLEGASSDLSGKIPKEFEGTNRAGIWRATWRLIKAEPITGVGFGGYWVAIAEHHDASGVYVPQQAHNDYLELLASGGVLGVIIWLWFVFAFVKRVRERLRSVDNFNRATCFGALAGIFAVAVHSVVDFGLHVTINALVFTTLVAVATLNGRVEKAQLTDT